MTFGRWTQAGSRNHVLGGSSDHQTGRGTFGGYYVQSFRQLTYSTYTMLFITSLLAINKVDISHERAAVLWPVHKRDFSTKFLFKLHVYLFSYNFCITSKNFRLCDIMQISMSVEFQLHTVHVQYMKHAITSVLKATFRVNLN